MIRVELIRRSARRSCREGVGRAAQIGIALLILASSAGLVASRTAYAADPTIAAVGDMACGLTETGYNGGQGTATRCRQSYVSDLLAKSVPTAVLDLGDNQYLNGELVNYHGVYDPTFGRVNSVVYPGLGNAEYGTPNAQGFFDYFQNVGVFSRIQSAHGDASHLLTGGYYSFDLGSWHIIALNSNCAEVGGCTAGSPQEAWLKSDLAAHPAACTLAYWHHPRWNSGSLGNDSRTSAFWTDLYSARADIVLNGHANHHYERDVPMSPARVADQTNGIQEFIVSTGGESHGTPPATPGNAGLVQAVDYTSFGVLRLTLHPTGYDWQFVPAAGGSFTDSGTGSCHAATTTVPDPPSLSATGGDSDVSLSWKAPASDGGAPITGYRIYRGTSAGNETLLASVGNVTSYQDTSAANGVTYLYRINAINNVGEGTQSNEVSAAPTAARPPAASVLDAFAGAPGPLSTNWRSPALGDSGTVSVVSGGQTAGSAGTSSATWSATTFAADQEVALGVAALPRAGDFLQLAGRVSTLGTSGLSAYILRVTPSTGTWDVRKKINGAASTSIHTFTAPVNAGDGIALQLVGPTLNVYRMSPGGGWAKLGSTSDTALAARGYVSFNLGDTTARGGSFAAGDVSQAPAAQVPDAATLAANAGDGVVSLSWTAPASDGGAAITSYKIYRGTTPGNETPLSTVGNVTSFGDASAVNGTTYYYRVAAVNSVGDGALSNEIAATPAAVGPTPPSTSMLDSFNSNPGPLSANWQSPGLGDPGTVSVTAPGVTAGSTGASSATWSATTFPANQEAYLTVPVLPRAGDFLQVVGRLNKLTATGVSCYFLRLTPSTSTWDVRKKINGATSTSIQTFNAPFNAGDSMALQIVGSKLTLFREPAGESWSLVGSATDTALTAAGYVGYTLGDTTTRGGSFGGGGL